MRCCCGEIWKGENVVAVCNVCNHNILAGAQHSKHSCYQLQPACAPHKKYALKFGQFCIVPSCCRKSSPTCGAFAAPTGSAQRQRASPVHYCILSSSAAAPTMCTNKKTDFSSPAVVPTMSTAKKLAFAATNWGHPNCAIRWRQIWATFQKDKRQKWTLQNPCIPDWT